MRQLLTLADCFHAMFSSSIVVGARPLHKTYRLKLMTPQGSSTRDGQLAVQHIMLFFAGKAAMVIGSAYHEERRVQLRTFAYLRHVHAEHFGDLPFDLDQDSYDGLFAHFEAFFSQMEFEISRLDAPGSAAAAPRMSATAQPASVSSPPRRATSILLRALRAVTGRSR